MSYKEWLYTQLENDGYIDSEEVDRSEISYDFLRTTTEVDGYDLDNYESQFAEHCLNQGVTADWDVDRD